MKKNILITGGLGHIGSAFLSSLKKNEFGKIIIIDNLLTQRFSSIFNKKNKINFQFYDYDISDDKIKSLFKEVDIVIHLYFQWRREDSERRVPNRPRSVRGDRPFGNGRLGPEIFFRNRNY